LMDADRVCLELKQVHASRLKYLPCTCFNHTSSLYMTDLVGCATTPNQT
jgi:hypothetical protein